MALVRYRAENPALLDRRRLDELILIFHRPSGQTHMVANPVPEILSALAGKACTVAELFDHLSQDFDLGERSAGEAELAGHLHALDALGLVRQA